jgi:hypothetical protein
VNVAQLLGLLGALPENPTGKILKRDLRKLVP